MYPIDESQRRAAKVAALSYLLAVVIVVFVNFGIHERLIVSGNAAETARNMMAHERLFRIGIAGDLIYCSGMVVLLSALYVILRPVSRGLALFATFCRLVYALMWIVMTLNFFQALQLLSGADYLHVFEAERLQVLAKLQLGANFDEYYVGLFFYGVASTICAWLWFKSGYISKLWAAWGMMSSAWCAVCSFVLFILPHFDKIVNLWWFDTPMSIFEIGLSFWLLFRGLRSSGRQGPLNVQATQV